MVLSWYVLATEPRAEYIAAAELRRDGLEIFFPLVKAMHNRAGHADEPLFPGYLFVRLSADPENWPSFRPAHRVIGWVNFQGIIPSVPEEAIANLERRVEAINAGQGLWRRFTPGETVRIVSGHIDTLAKVVAEAKSPQARANVLLDFMGRQISAQVPWADIRPVENQTREKHRVPRRTRGNGRWVQNFRPDLVPTP